jgi:hypothetical protein
MKRIERRSVRSPADNLKPGGGSFPELEEIQMSILKWLGGASDRFSDKGNWAPHRVPNSHSDVLIEPSPATTIVAATTEINSLVTNANTNLAVGATGIFTIVGAPDAEDPTGASTNGGTFSLGQSAELFLDGQFTNAGQLVTGDRSDIIVDGAFTNAGVVDQNGDLTLGDPSHPGSLTNERDASWSINGDVNIIGAVGSRWTNAGTFTRSGTGVTDVIDVSTANSGAVNVTSGELDFISDTGALLSNTGTMTATDATLILDETVTGVGKLNLGAGGALTLVGGSDAGQTVDFLGENATLDLVTRGEFSGHISGFGAHDLIDLVDTIVNHESFASGVLTLSDGSTPVARLNFNGAFSTSSFSLSTDHSGGTLIHFV